MKISTRGRYGLKALADIAKNAQELPVTIKDIACRQGIPPNYLEQLMATLKKAGFVKSLRGAAGGYVLAKPPEEITVGGVLRALEGATLINCDGAGCGEADCNGCVTKSTWAALNARLETAAESITLLDICNQDI